MLVTNFKLKYFLHKMVCSLYQLADVSRVHPLRERSLRELQRTVDYIEKAMPDALGLETKREIIDFALKSTAIEGHYLNYPNWERHEYRAFQEFVRERAVGYSYLGFARQQVAVRIDSVGAQPQ
jgi:hypothetical protein